MEIEESLAMIHESTIKNQLESLKQCNKKIHKTNKEMVNILSKLNIVTCHTFIDDKISIDAPLNIILDSLKDEHLKAENEVMAQSI